MGEEKPTESRTRPKFEPEFKNVTVRLVELGNRSVTQVAEELDISEATLTNWVKNARKAKRAASTFKLIHLHIRKELDEPGWCRHLSSGTSSLSNTD